MIVEAHHHFVEVMMMLLMAMFAAGHCHCQLK